MALLEEMYRKLVQVRRHETSEAEPRADRRRKMRAIAKISITPSGVTASSGVLSLPGSTGNRCHCRLC
jgi:hypothetical protein